MAAHDKQAPAFRPGDRVIWDPYDGHSETARVVEVWLRVQLEQSGDHVYVTPNDCQIADPYAATASAGLSGQLPVEAAAIAEQLRHAGFPDAGAVNRQVLGLAEEVGEFVGAYRRWSGQARRRGTAEHMFEELADVIITAFVCAHELGIDIDQVIAAKLATVHTRGWRDEASGGETR